MAVPIQRGNNQIYGCRSRLPIRSPLGKKPLSQGIMVMKLYHHPLSAAGAAAVQRRLSVAAGHELAGGTRPVGNRPTIADVALPWHRGETTLQKSVGVADRMA